MRAVASFMRQTKASSAIEFAILAPVFILMMTGMMAYAVYFGAAHSVQQIAADAARTSIAGLNQTERNALVSAFIINNANAYPLIQLSQLSYTVGDKPNDASQYLVTVTYNAVNLPIWNFYPPLPLPSPIITFSSTIRRGGL